VEKLRRSFTVITPDLRGHGESPCPPEPGRFHLDRLLEDVLAVADAESADRFRLWGFSFGGTIGMRLAVRTNRVKRAVLGGAFFGPVFSPAYEERTRAIFGAVDRARAEGVAIDADLSPNERWLAESALYPLARALFQAMTAWPPVEPREVKCPMFLYAGAEFKTAADAYARDAEAMRTAGVEWRVWAGLDHMAEFSRIDVTFEEAFAFLHQAGEP
jgi:pimeloyl-ACP methyl ester carboxylesterase